MLLPILSAVGLLIPLLGFLFPSGIADLVHVPTLCPSITEDTEAGLSMGLMALRSITRFWCSPDGSPLYPPVSDVSTPTILDIALEKLEMETHEDKGVQAQAYKGYQYLPQPRPICPFPDISLAMCINKHLYPDFAWAPQCPNLPPALAVSICLPEDAPTSPLPLASLPEGSMASSIPPSSKVTHFWVLASGCLVGGVCVLGICAKVSKRLSLATFLRIALGVVSSGVMCWYNLSSDPDPRVALLAVAALLYTVGNTRVLQWVLDIKRLIKVKSNSSHFKEAFDVSSLDQALVCFLHFTLTTVFNISPIAHVKHLAW